MNTYVIRRRNAWNDAEELEATAGVSLRIGNDEMAEQIRWIRSCVVYEADGTLVSIKQRVQMPHAITLDESGCRQMKSHL